jgi:hypothetical protein
LPPCLQTEAELQGLDAAEVERLAAEAADLQARAATALRLAQRRLLLTADACLVLLAVLRGQRWAVAGL